MSWHPPWTHLCQVLNTLPIPALRFPNRDKKQWANDGCFPHLDLQLNTSLSLKLQLFHAVDESQQSNLIKTGPQRRIFWVVTDGCNLSDLTDDDKKMLI